MVTYENKIIRRSWKERLLSWPWKPWKAEKLKKALEEGKDASTFGLPTTKF
jgi:hypothetical protein